MRFWIGVASAFGAGALIGTGLGILLVEDKLKKEYVEANASFRRALEAARIDAETPTDFETDLIVRPRDPEGTSLEGGEIVTAPEDGTMMTKSLMKSENPYHRAVSETSPLIYASYAELEEEDYYEEDGRVKEQLTMIFDNGVARFFEGGEEIDDAFERVGGTIVDDMRTAVGAGRPTIWVRNNQTEVDYEVIFEQP